MKSSPRVRQFFEKAGLRVRCRLFDPDQHPHVFSMLLRDNNSLQESSSELVLRTVLGTIDPAGFCIRFTRCFE